MVIGDKKVVLLDYVLKSAEGEVLDSSAGVGPLAYLHGVGQIVPGLERALVGLAPGDAKDVVVPPEDGYGVPDADGVFGVPRDAFPDEVELVAGESFVGQDEDGAEVPVRIVEVRDDMVVVDANHPLAGQTLYFHVDVREVRDATDEELAADQPVGPPAGQPTD